MPEHRSPEGHNFALNVLASSRLTNRSVGPLAWILLEELALRTEGNAGELLVETTVRDLAADLMVGKDAVATALGRLVGLGLIRCHTRRRAGRYAGSGYSLDVDACRRAGLVLATVDGATPPCPQPPCPIEPDTEQPDPVNPATTPTAQRREPSRPSAAAGCDRTIDPISLRLSRTCYFHYSQPPLPLRPFSVNASLPP